MKTRNLTAVVMPVLRVRFTLIACAVQLLLSLQLSHGAGQQSGALPVVTDQVSVPLSDKYFVPSLLGLKDNGDVFFGGTDSLFLWSHSSGLRTRLLQSHDPIPGFPGSVVQAVAYPIQPNAAGHAAMINTWAQEGVRNPGGIFVYDGEQYTKVALTGDAAPGIAGGTFSAFRDLRVNQNDQVAFTADYDPIGEYITAIFFASPGSPPQKIATMEELRNFPDGNRYDTIQLLGVDDSGRVAFLCDRGGQIWSRAVFIGTPAGFQRVVASNDPAPGTTGSFSLPGIGSYMLNSAGDLVIQAGIYGDPTQSQGIWIRSAGGSLQKLITNSDATGTSLGGNFGSSISLRGFNNVGKVLFSSTPSGGATSNHALFLKDASSPAAVVFSRNQAVTGRTGAGSFNTTIAARLNENGKVALFASLRNGSSLAGWFLGSGAAAPQIIALQGDATPIGGTYGQVTNSPLRMNNSDQVVFRSDILQGINANGLFIWTPGGSIQSIVSTNDPLPSEANQIFLGYGPYATPDYSPHASDDELIFWSLKTGGKDTIFTRSLRPGDETIRRIAGDGDAAPGGGVITTIDSAVMNDNEEAVFWSTILGGPVYPAQALWLSRPGMGLQKLVMNGDAAPGTGGGTLQNFTGWPRINNQTQVAFAANIAGSNPSSTSGIFLTSPGGTVQKIARIGDASPAGGTFVSFSTTIWLNDAGQVGFRAGSQDGPTYRDGLFVGTATAAPVKVVAMGDPLGGGTVNYIGGCSRMNSSGHFAIIAGVQGGKGGVFLGAPGSDLVALALEDGPAPMPDDSTFLVFGGGGMQLGLDLNNNGQVAFWGVYSIPTAPFYGIGYFLASEGTNPVARLYSGQALPGGGTFYGSLPLDGGIALADSGELAMYAPYVSDAPDLPRYVIANRSGVLRNLAATGEAAAGTGSEFGRLTSFVTANSVGRFFFSATLVNGPARAGIFENGYPPCTPSATELCLNDNRFRVAVNWSITSGASGTGTAVPLTSDSGYFWFFSDTNVELLVKILDGRSINGSYWVFYGAMTDVQYTITITDTVTGEVKTYQGEQGVQKSANDINAFYVGGAASAASAAAPALARETEKFKALMQSMGKAAAGSVSALADGQTALYLNNNRFKVEVSWSIPSGTTGVGTAAPLTSDSGYFWFFGATNVELLVKILDGRGVNGHFWFFWGALTDVQYTITVTDTQTGAVKLYQGQQGVQKSGNDINAF